MQRFYFLLFLFPSLLIAQMGCPDEMALNYDPLVETNDGSCFYPATDVNPQIIVDLPSELTECSGLVGYQNYWIGINDSGNSNQLILLDKSSGNFIRSIEITNATNVDWEALSIFGNKLFIADSGNNLGNRVDLGIYSCSLLEIEEDEIEAEFYPYSYADQLDFNMDPETNPFDCEALIVDEKGIHLFSKGRNFGKIKQYDLDYESGEKVAIPVDSFNVNGFVTGASIDEDGTLGFTGIDGEAFLWLFYDYQSGSFFSGNKRKIGLGILGQNESLFLENNQAWISSENTFIPGRLFSLSYNQWISTSVLEALSPVKLTFSPNPFTNYVEIETSEKEQLYYSLVNSMGQIVSNGELGIDARVEGLDDYQKGSYWITVYSEDFRYSTKLIKL